MMVSSYASGIARQCRPELSGGRLIIPAQYPPAPIVHKPPQTTPLLPPLPPEVDENLPDKVTKRQSDKNEQSRSAESSYKRPLSPSDRKGELNLPPPTSEEGRSIDQGAGWEDAALRSVSPPEVTSIGICDRPEQPSGYRPWRVGAFAVDGISAEQRREAQEDEAGEELTSTEQRGGLPEAVPVNLEEESLKEQRRDFIASSLAVARRTGSMRSLQLRQAIQRGEGLERWQRPSAMAAVPVVARDMLATMSREGSLLPRDEEARRIINSLKKVHAQTNNRNNTSGASSGTSQATGTGGSNGNGLMAEGTGISVISASPDVFDTMKFITVVQGMGGMGKTTIAAMVIHRQDVRSHFCEGIAWIKLGQHKQKTNRSNHQEQAEDQKKTSYDEYQLTFTDYKQHITTLCRQLCVQPPEFDEVVILPGEDESIKTAKTLIAMENAKQDMTNLLAAASVLLVLDGLWHPPDLKWFQFANRPTSGFRLLITTRVSIYKSPENKTSNENSGDDSGAVGSKEKIISLTALKEEEAMSLLISECRSACWSAAPRHQWSDEGKEHALTIVKSCGCLPVAVRSLGRILAASMRDVGRWDLVECMRGLAQDLATTDFSRRGTNSESDTNMREAGKRSVQKLFKSGYTDMYDILDKSLSPNLHGNTTTVLKMCFATFALVFSRNDSNRPWVPVTAVHSLWDGIITDSGRNDLKCRPGKWVTIHLLEKMEALGLLDSDVSSGDRRRSRDISTDEQNEKREPGREIMRHRLHHDLMLQYAKHIWENDRTLRREIATLGFQGRKSCFKGLLQLSALKRNTREKGDSAVLARLHFNLAKKFEKKLKRSWDGPWIKEAEDDGYVFQYLPHHMMMASDGTVALQWVFHLLQDEGFVKQRIAALGIDWGMKQHAVDVETLIDLYHESRKERNSEVFLNREVLCAVNAMLSYLKRQLPPKDNIQNGKVQNCWQILRIEVGEAFVTAGTSLQSQRLWIQALDAFSEALEIFKDAGLPADNQSVSRARLLANSSSLPKLVLVPRDSPNCIKLKHAWKLRELARKYPDDSTTPDEGDEVPMDLNSHPGLGIVLSKSGSVGMMGGNMYPLSIGPSGNSVRICPRGHLLWKQASNTVFGSWTGTYEGDSVFLTPLSYASHTKFPGATGSYSFVVNEDGTVSPTGNSNLALGIGPVNVMLVSRNSPNRIILKHGAKIKKSQHCQVGHTPTGGEGHSLELISHPGRGIVMQQICALNVGSFRLNFPGMGPAEKAIKVSYDGRILACAETGAVFALHFCDDYHVGTPLLVIRGNRKGTTRWKGSVGDFVINEEGSISPMHAPHLAIGCPTLGISHDIITAESRKVAEKQARLKPKPMPFRNKLRTFALSLGFLVKFKESEFRSWDF